MHLHSLGITTVHMTTAEVQTICLLVLILANVAIINLQIVSCLFPSRELWSLLP